MFEAFISFKNLDPNTGQQTRDSQIAQQLYNCLTEAGISTFYSNVEVQRSSDARWGKLIDSALQETRVIIVVGTRLDYVESEWVEYEWRYFSEQIRTGKNKQMLTVLEGLAPAALPPAFTQVQSYSAKDIDSAVDKVLWILGKQRSMKKTEQPASATLKSVPVQTVQPAPTAIKTQPTSQPAAMRKSINTGKLATIVAALVAGLVLVPMMLSGGEKGGCGTAAVSSEFPQLADISVGDHLFFGSYEQDNDFTNGAEPIEWRVLDIRDDGNVLIMSEYGLDAVPYNEDREIVTWEACSLRSWLNNDFYSAAFSYGEKQLIIETTVCNPDNPFYKTDGGSDTLDNVFCLSIDEAERYFSDDADRKCKPTEYSVSDGAYSLSTCSWWLRSPGWRRGSGDFAANVSPYGGIEFIGTYSFDGRVCVRPVLYLNPES